MPTQSRVNLLLVTADPELAQQLKGALPEPNFAVEWVNTQEKAFNFIDAAPPDAILTDLAGPRIDGLRVMTVGLERNPHAFVIMLAETPQIELATEAMRQGAYDFQLKPLNLARLAEVVKRGIEHQRLLMDQSQLRRRLDEHFGLQRLVGHSRSILATYEKIKEIAPTDVPVIVVGGPGTGKDLVAHIIHHRSPRAASPLVKLNCSPENAPIVKRELFGHAANAFPGASEARPGRTELADGGTLYLDEVSDLPALIVQQLLQTLASGITKRVGDDREIQTDVRLIVSVIPPLEKSDKTEDLLRGLRQQFDAVVLELPPLRDRIEDLPLLVEQFLPHAAAIAGKPTPAIEPAALDVLMRYDWPENVRELRNAIERLAQSAPEGRALDIQDIPAHIRSAAAGTPNEIRVPVGTPMKEIERIAIEQTLKACDYKKESAAKTLGIGLRTLYRKLKEFE